MSTIISVTDVSKIYATGFRALDRVSLDIRQGEIFALLGPNGAGKTTLIGLICGIVKLGEGSVTVAGHDIVADYREVRAMIGLVPQELTSRASCSSTSRRPASTSRCARTCGSSCAACASRA